MKKVIVLLLITMLIMTVAAPTTIAEPKHIKPGDGGTIIDDTVATPLDPIVTDESGRAPDGSIQLVVDGKRVESEVKAFLDEADRTQAPFRAIGEALGCTVDWEDETEKVTCTREGTVIEMFIGNSRYWVNGIEKVMDTAPLLKEDRTFVPVRAVSEALDFSVAWNGSALIVFIRSNK